MIEFSSDKLIEKYLDAIKLDRFLKEVQSANRKFNLYSRNFQLHHLKLLVAESLIPFELAWINKNIGPILDIGSGWGIPAIPMLLTGRNLDISLVERSQKKADFLLLLINRLKLKADIIAGDIGTFEFEDKYELASLRGVTLDHKIMHKLPQIIKPGGSIIYFGSNFPGNWRESSQLVEYSIDNLPVRHLIKSSVF
jgi:16S rRNA (guanine527-N7)-methyltransferase